MRQKLPKGSEVILIWKGHREKYGRLLGRVIMPDGLDMANAIVKGGLCGKRAGSGRGGAGVGVGTKQAQCGKRGQSEGGKWETEVFEILPPLCISRPLTIPPNISSCPRPGLARPLLFYIEIGYFLRKLRRSC